MKKLILIACCLSLMACTKSPVNNLSKIELEKAYNEGYQQGFADGNMPNSRAYLAIQNWCKTGQKLPSFLQNLTGFDCTKKRESIELPAHISPDFSYTRRAWLILAAITVMASLFIYGLFFAASRAMANFSATFLVNRNYQKDLIRHEALTEANTQLEHLQNEINTLKTKRNSESAQIETLSEQKDSLINEIDLIQEKLSELQTDLQARLINFEAAADLESTRAALEKINQKAR